MNPASNYDIKIKKRIRLAHIAAQELGLLDPKRRNTDPDDDYHRILARWHRQGTRQPVTSSTQMNFDQLGELLDFFKGLGFRVKPRNGSTPSPQSSPHEGRGSGSWKKYESSISGLKQEICDIAKERFGEAWEQPLNNLCRRFGVQRWQWLDVAHGKEIKNAIIRMNAADRNPALPAANDEVPF